MMGQRRCLHCSASCQQLHLEGSMSKVISAQTLPLPFLSADVFVAPCSPHESAALVGKGRRKYRAIAEHSV